jgi:hypothetical protein
VAKILLYGRCDYFGRVTRITQSETTRRAGWQCSRCLCFTGFILIECASKFTGEVMRILCRHLKISKIITILFRPHSNSNIEKSHATITECLRHFFCKDQNNWDTLWPTATFGYKTTPHTQNKCCPFELVFGRETSIPGLLQSLSQYPD